VLNETAHRCKCMPYRAGMAWNQGGIVDSVELLVAPAVRVADLFVRADPKTGTLRVQAMVTNAAQPARARIELTVAPAAGGETVAARGLDRELPPGTVDALFDGLPAGGLLDTTFYRELIPDHVWAGQQPPAEAVAGAINAAQDYSSGLLVAVHARGAGRVILNTMRIRDKLGRHPAAERLLRNVLRYAARDIAEPLADLPDDFDATLKTFGYE